MMQAPAAPRSLLIHDGELADVRALLVALQVPFIERLGPESEQDRYTPWDLVVASAKRILDLHLPSSVSTPTQIAILSHDARTLRSSLRRRGRTMLVRRPVHPSALRALVLHSLYRGPEKRRAARVSVGAPVRVKLGWRQRPALLIDLSVSGCRLITDRMVDRGTPFRVQIPAEVTGSKALSLGARVVECSASRDQALGRFVTTAQFDPPSTRVYALLQAAVDVHSEGPAVCEGAPAIAEAAAAERRGETRHQFDHTVVSLEEQAARVLMGRDLSRRGMRVSPNPRLLVGMRLRLAVHPETREAPLILKAIVDRDDGERGLMLRFEGLSEEANRYLEYVIHALPLVIDDDDDEGCLVTELLEAS